MSQNKYKKIPFINKQVYIANVSKLNRLIKMADGRKNNGGVRPGAGRKGYGIELQKKRVLEQAFHTTKMALLKEAQELKEKEKIELASKIVLKELGKNIDITSKGESIKSLVQFIDGNSNNKNTS